METIEEDFSMLSTPIHLVKDICWVFCVWRWKRRRTSRVLPVGCAGTSYFLHYQINFNKNSYGHCKVESSSDGKPKGLAPLYGRALFTIVFKLKFQHLLSMSHPMKWFTMATIAMSIHQESTTCPLSWRSNQGLANLENIDHGDLRKDLIPTPIQGQQGVFKAWKRSLNKVYKDNIQQAHLGWFNYGAIMQFCRFETNC